MKKFDLVIKNGTVVTASDMFSADLGVKDGKIAAIAENIEADAEEVFDAAGKLVLPGALDVHTHLAMPFGGTISSDSYLSGTRAAACGGVQRSLTIRFSIPAKPSAESLQRKRLFWKKKHVWILHPTAVSRIFLTERSLRRWKRP